MTDDVILDRVCHLLHRLSAHFLTVVKRLIALEEDMDDVYEQVDALTAAVADLAARDRQT